LGAVGISVLSLSRQSIADVFTTTLSKARFLYRKHCGGGGGACLSLRSALLEWKRGCQAERFRRGPKSRSHHTQFLW